MQMQVRLRIMNITPFIYTAIHNQQFILQRSEVTISLNVLGGFLVLVYKI